MGCVMSAAVKKTKSSTKVKVQQTVYSEQEVRTMFKRARAMVIPIIEKEKEGEKIDQQTLNFRLR